MRAMAVKFGAVLPQGWRFDLVDVDGAAAKFERMVDVAREAEAAGFDSVWLADHFHTMPRPAAEDMFECWTAMAALARETSTVRLGQMVTCSSYRPPALLAKMAACIDVMSHGRLFFGIGAGWHEEEYAAYGYDFPPIRTRLEMLGEAVAVIKGMWAHTPPPL